MITWINESKILTKNVSCKWKWKFDGRKSNQMKSEIIITVGVGVKFRQNICAKKIILGIILNVVAKMLDMQKVLLWFNSYMWWNYRNNKNSYNQKNVSKF